MNIKDLKHYEFENKKSMEYFLSKELSKISSNGEYNLFMHKGYALDSDERGRDITFDYNMTGIYRNGLALYKYTSLLNTSKYQGVLDNESAQKAINYTYSWPLDKQYNYMLVLPKNIEINGVSVDFTTPKSEVKPFGYGDQHTMAYDATKSIYLPTEFILGTIITNVPNITEEEYLASGEKYHLFLNPQHFYKLDKIQQGEIIKPIIDTIVGKSNIQKEDNLEVVNDKIEKWRAKENSVNHSHESTYDI